MKEATGELNITVITIVAIAALAAFFYLAIWPGIQANMALTTACNANDPGYKSGDDQGQHVSCSGSVGDVTCTYYKDAADQGTTKTCNPNNNNN